MTSWEIRNKIAEIRSYIASDWPNIEERRRLYAAAEKMEKLLAEAEKDEAEKNKIVGQINANHFLR